MSALGVGVVGQSGSSFSLSFCEVVVEIKDVIHSKIDRTVKYVMGLDDGMISEVAYIDKNDGKDILCVASQTACLMGCKFCHTTDSRGKLTVRNITAEEIHQAVKVVYEELSLQGKNRLLLVSYMGCGEPLLNAEEVVRSMHLVRDMHGYSRFAVATMFPRTHWANFFNLLSDCQDRRLNVKIHLSLHFTKDGIRRDWMPQALEIKPSIVALEFWKRMGGSVEIHYALIDGVNDSYREAMELMDLVQGRNIPVKLLKYNERRTIGHHSSSEDQTVAFRQLLESYGVTVEYYEPPGIDVGASCGQFLMDYYLKYNGKIRTDRLP